MQFNCRLIRRLKKENILGKDYYLCPSSGGCVHGGRGEVDSRSVCELKPDWRVAVKYSKGPVRNEGDVNRFYEVMMGRYYDEFVDIVLNESWNNIYGLYKKFFGEKYNNKSE
jgi:hypothetical protein